VHTTGEAAEICGLSLSTIKRWIKRGALRVYRTPGGDIRIPHENLCDFMREYDIPLQHTGTDEARVLVAVCDADLRRTLVRRIMEQYPRVRVEIADGEMELGFSLGSMQPWAVICQPREGSESAGALCRRIRECLAPESVRIGLVGMEGEGTGGRDHADLTIDPAADNAELAMFVQNLLDSVLQAASRSDREKSVA